MKDKDHVATPPWLMGLFVGFHDPCPLGATQIIEPPPFVPIYVNPPFSEGEVWIERAIKWHQEGHYVALLIPMESSTLKVKRILQYGVNRIYFEKRVWGNVRGVELLILTGAKKSKGFPYQREQRDLEFFRSLEHK